MLIFVSRHKYLSIMVSLIWACPWKKNGKCSRFICEVALWKPNHLLVQNQKSKDQSNVGNLFIISNKDTDVSDVLLVSYSIVNLKQIPQIVLVIPSLPLNKQTPFGNRLISEFYCKLTVNLWIMSFPTKIISQKVNVLLWS